MRSSSSFVSAYTVEIPQLSGSRRVARILNFAIAFSKRSKLSSLAFSAVTSASLSFSLSGFQLGE